MNRIGEAILEGLPMEKRCFGCMNTLDGTVCRVCGLNNADPAHVKEAFLKPGSVIGGRYYAGLSIDRNGEGITYIAFDNNIQTRVRLREFFPGALCHRESDHRTVRVNPGCEIQYKALMTDFAELSRQLIGITANNNLLKAKDILADNGTLYVVYEDVTGVTLAKYLKDNAGELSWEETENLFLPLLYTVKLLNANGITHRGISPDTILVTNNHELKLKGVCTSAVRAINTEIRPELFSGYAAPEQYEKCTSHGEWTDVYAICAVLYRTLTGAMPEQADNRSPSGDELIPPAELNPRIPRNVSQAIMRGLAPDRAARTPTIKDLIGGLYAAAPPVRQPARRIIEEEDEDEMDPQITRHPSAPPRRKKRRFRVPVWLIVILITLPVLLCLFFLLYDLMVGGEPGGGHTSSYSSSAPVSSSQPVSSAPVSSQEPTSSSSGGPKILVDNLVGRYYEDVIGSETFAELYKFGEKREVFDESFPVGQILEQSIEPNTVVEQGSELILTVSKGPQYVLLPPLTDGEGKPVPVDTYKTYLEEKGVEVAIEEIDDVSFEAGEIVRVNPPADSNLNRETENKVTIYVSTGESYDILHRSSGSGDPEDLTPSEDDF